MPADKLIDIVTSQNPVPAMPDWSVPVLYYHHVSSCIDFYTNTTPPVFAAQISELSKQYSFWTISDALMAFRRGESTDGRLVVTFDDGYQDVYDNALPILSQYGVRATFFILPEFVGRENSWDPKRVHRATHMEWPQLEHLVADGHEIGSHGMTHRSLCGLSESEVRWELQTSKDLLEDNLRQNVAAFCYPYGICDGPSSRIASEVYESAFSTVKSHHRNWHTHRHSLRREYLPKPRPESDD